MFLDDIVGPMSIKEAKKKLSGADKFRKTISDIEKKYEPSDKHYDRLKNDPAYREQEFQKWQKEVHGDSEISEDAWTDGQNAWSSEHDQWAKESVEEDTGSWIVYDPETKQIKKRFKTHTAGKSYAKTHGLGFASSEYYFDNVKQLAVAEVKQRLDAKCWKGKHKEGTKIKGGVRVNNCVPNESVEEALSKKDLLKQVGDKLNDPEFRKQPADPTKRWEKGDLYQGPGPDDYGYTGYQGHGMPTDKAERARIRADKKKGVAEMDKSQKGAAGWNIDDYPLGAKGTTAKPTTVKNVVKSATKDLDAAFDRTKEPEPSGIKKKNEFDIKESYWTKLQNERNTKLNSLVDELKESIKK